MDATVHIHHAKTLVIACFNNSLNSIRSHWLGLIVSIAVGVVVAAPPLVWRHSSEYKGVDLLKTNTEQHYIAQVQEVYDGDPLVRNPFFKDLKNTPYLFPPLSPNIVAWFGKIFGLNALDAVIYGRLFFISLLALLAYSLSYQLFQTKIVAAVTAPFVILGYALLDPNYTINFLHGHLPVSFNDYGRPINPQISSLFFFGYMVALWRWLHAPTRRYVAGAAAVLILGASFYVYLYTWTYVFALNGILVLIYGSKRDWEKVKRIMGVSILAALASIPYFLNAYQASLYPSYHESALRFGFIKNHAPAFSRLVAALALLFIVYYKKMATPVRLFFVGVFITAVVVVNEQVITGLFIFNDHYHWYFTTPLMIIFITYFLYDFVLQLTKRTWTAQAVSVAILVFVLIHGILIQRHAYLALQSELIDEQRYAPLFAWLNNKVAPVVVFGSYPILRFTPALTHHDVYYSGTGIYTLVPNERLLHSYLMYAYLQGIPANKAREYFQAHRADITSFVFGYTYDFKSGQCSSCFPEAIIEDLVRRYNQISDKTFALQLKKYPIDYVVWDKKSDPNWRVDNLGLKKTVTFGDIMVYQLP